MDLKQWRTPVIILAGLAVVYLLTTLGDARHTTAVDTVFDLEKDDVGRIVMVVDNQSAQLRRLDSLWVMSGYEDRQIRQWRLTSFFTNVLAVQRESMVSSNPEKWATFGVDDVGSRQVKIYDMDDELAGHFMVGQSKTNYQSSYLRRINGDDVYLTNKNIYNFLSADSAYWLEPLPEPVEETEAAGEVEPLDVEEALIKAGEPD